MVTSGQPFPMSKLAFMYVKRLAEPLGMDCLLNLSLKLKI